MSRRIGLAVLIAVAAALAGGQAASASQGSVPAEVAAYAADPSGLLAAVDDVAGVGADGKGIALDDTAKVGPLNRVFVFTPAFLAGEATETPIERVNEWTAPIELGGKPLGLATIWINPASVAPELGAFEVGATIGAAFLDVPADAYLVRDAAHEAWFTLVGEELAPVVAGSSGFDAPTTLDDYQEFLLEEQAAVVVPPTSIAPVLSLVVIIVSVLIIAAVLLAPVIRERRRARAQAHAGSAAEPVPSTALVVEVPTSKAVVPVPPKATTPAAKAATKPTGSTKPSAATKPTTGKPAAARAVSPKSATAKSAAAKSATAKSATAKSAAGTSSPTKTPSAPGTKPAASRKPKPAAPSE